jgi:hypothetical protein
MNRMATPAGILLASLTVVAAVATTSAAPPTCRGEVATVVGTEQAEVIVGTDGADVIVALGGADTVRSLGGADIVCTGDGEDRVHGGAGRDELAGGNADDTMQGGTGQDRLYGNAGDDVLDGGLHDDACFQGSGTGKRVDCENLKVLALAFTDLDGDHAFGSNDVLIAKLVDTNDDKVPSVGDTITMGRYPTNLTPGPADFADWNVTSHVVTDLSLATAKRVTVWSAGGWHAWVAKAAAEWFEESNSSPATDTDFQDGFVSTAGDVLYVVPGSPSGPATAVSNANLTRPANDAFIDVVIDP